MESVKRPLTQSERKALEAMSRNPFTWQSAFGMAAFLSFLTLGLILILSRYISLFRSLQPYLIGVSFIIWFFFSFRSHYRLMKSFPTKMYQKDLEEGTAVVVSYKATAAIKVQEFEDLGSNYFVQLSDGSVLFLSGQYLYEPEEDKKFPCTDFDLVRAANSGVFLDLVCRGSYSPPAKVLRPFRKELFKADKLPSDGEIIATPWDKIEEDFTEPTA